MPGRVAFTALPDLNACASNDEWPIRRMFKKILT